MKVCCLSPHPLFFPSSLGNSCLAHSFFLLLSTILASCDFVQSYHDSSPFTLACSQQEWLIGLANNRQTYPASLSLILSSFFLRYLSLFHNLGYPSQAQAFMLIWTKASNPCARPERQLLLFSAISQVTNPGRFSPQFIQGHFFFFYRQCVAFYLFKASDIEKLPLILAFSSLFIFYSMS